MDIRELATRYSKSEQAMRKYLQRYEQKLNANGEHVKRVGRTWQVDAEGVKLLDKMRGYVEPTVEQLETRRDEISDLREENRRLMSILLASQSEIIRLQKEILRLKEPPPNLFERLRNMFSRK